MKKRGRPTKLTAMEEMAVYQMKKEGKPNVEIAFAYGIDTATVYRISKKIEKKVEGEDEG